MALSQASPEFRKVLEKVRPPRDVEVKIDSVDSLLRSLVNAVVNLMTRFSISRARQPATLSRQLDVLADGLSAVQASRNYLAAMSRYNPVRIGDEYLSDKLRKGSATKVA